MSDTESAKAEINPDGRIKETVIGIILQDIKDRGLIFRVIIQQLSKEATKINKSFFV